MRQLWIIFVMCLGLNASAHALSLAQALQQTLAQHPDTTIAASKIAQAEAKQLAAEGGFDWQLSSQSQLRSSGYYDSWYSGQTVGKQLAWNGAKIQAGYRLAGGDSPVYETRYDTLGAGEANVKLSLPLLQGRQIDPYRANRLEADISLGIERLKAQLIANDLLSMAASRYLQWYLAQQELAIAQQLLVLAEDRFSAAQTRERIGESSRMEVLEVEANLVARRADVAQKQQYVQLAKIYLREFVGHDVELNTPILGQYGLTGFDHLERAMAQHPKLRMVDQEIAQLDQQLLLAKNQLLPQVDMDVFVAQDVGQGDKNLEGTESYIGLSATMPLGQRKAKGKYALLQQKKHQLTSEREKIQRQLMAQTQAELAKIDGLNSLMSLRQQQVNAATTLAEQEQVRFKARVGDVFRLNLREQSLAKARWALQKNTIDIVKAELDFLAKTAQLPQWVNKIEAAQ